MVNKWVLSMHGVTISNHLQPCPLCIDGPKWKWWEMNTYYFFIQCVLGLDHWKDFLCGILDCLFDYLIMFLYQRVWYRKYWIILPDSWLVLPKLKYFMNHSNILNVNFRAAQEERLFWWRIIYRTEDRYTSWHPWHVEACIKQLKCQR